MTNEQAAQRAYDLFQGGWHCAEAILSAVLERFETTQPPVSPRIATCFGGGIARTHEELCGAFTGGLIALGCLCGRDRAGQDWSESARIASDFRQYFLATHGTTCCGELLQSFGPQEGMVSCKRMTAQSAEALCDIIAKARNSSPSSKSELQKAE